MGYPWQYKNLNSTQKHIIEQREKNEKLLKQSQNNIYRNKIKIARLEIRPDYETPEGSENAGAFQIFELKGYNENEEEIYFTNKIDQGQFYRSKEKVLSDITENCPNYDFSTCDTEFV